MIFYNSIRKLIILLIVIDKRHNNLFSVLENGTHFKNQNPIDIQDRRFKMLTNYKYYFIFMFHIHLFKNNREINLI